MILVHRDGAEAPLPEMPGAAVACVDMAGIAPVDRGQRAPLQGLDEQCPNRLDIQILLGHINGIQISI